LLLAEAFWLMEGYFVRTLGMHRVYNSAFMVMLRDEDNAKYRSVIKNTLEFDPDIMKRYVNFMSNPDERTAIDQFGKGDKCFGVTVMMATLPGLPMFGHGQIEGFTEKYGMEYQRPRYDESPDPWMVERHEREIAPLLQRRRLFAESSNFLLYDFFLDSGKVDENVFAYSNRNGNERALVVYNNHYGETRGTIDYSAAYADKGSGQLRQQRLREGLGLSENYSAILAWRDSLTGLEYLRRASDLSEHGLTFDLHAYQCYVYLEWREMYATAEQPWDRLCDHLNGRGVPDLEDALVNLDLQPVQDALRAQLDPGIVRLFADLAEHPRTLVVGMNNEIETERTDFFDQAWERCESFLRLAQKAYLSRSGASGIQPANPGLLRTAFRERLRAAMRIPTVESLFSAPWTVAARRILPSPSPQLTATSMWGPVLGWCVLELLAESFDSETPGRVALDLFDRLRLREPFAQAFNALGFEGEEGWRVAARIKVLLLTGAGVGKPEETSAASEPAEPAASTDEQITLSFALWHDPDVCWLTGVHKADGHAYLVREPYEELLWWLLMPSLLRLAGEASPSHAAVEEMSRTVEEALATAEAAGYRVDLLLAPSAPETAAEEPASDADSGTLPAVEPAAELAAEPEPEPGAESEVSAEAQHLCVYAEPSERAELKTDPVAEPEAESAVESPAESDIEPEASVEVQSLSIEPVEPEIEPVAEIKVEPAAEPESEPEVEPDASAEAQPLSLESSEPAELETDPVAEPEAEPAVKSYAEPDIEPEASAEAHPLSPESIEPVEPEIEPVAEFEVETAAEPESEPEIEPEASAEAQPFSLEPSEPAELETDPVAEPEIEPAVESYAEPDIEPEESAQAQLLPIESSEPTEPEIDPLAEFRLEPAEESTSEPEVEPEASAEAQPQPTEAGEPAELETDLATEPEAEPAVESSAEPDIEPKASAEAQPFSPEPSERVEQETDSVPEPQIQPVVETPAEPDVETEASVEAQPLSIEQSEATKPEFDPVVVSEVEAAGESTSESEVEPEALAEAQPFSPKASEPAELETDPIAEPEVEPAVEYPAEPESEPEVSAEAQLLSPEPHEPENPKINSGVESIAQPKADSEAFIGWRFLSSEPWEPAAPKIEFTAKRDAGFNAAEESRSSPTGQWEPAASRIVKPNAEPKAVAEAQHLPTEPWEPPAPKIEFAAKPADEPKAAEEAIPAPAQRQKPADREIDSSANTAGDSGDPA
jgi:hypothetical protein